jgi:hypothetical protein
MSTPAIKTDTAGSKLDAKALARKKFEDVWEVIRAELLVHFEAQGMPIDAREWYKRVSTSAAYAIALIISVYRTWITMRLVVNSIEACLSLIRYKSFEVGR